MYHVFIISYILISYEYIHNRYQIIFAAWPCCHATINPVVSLSRRPTAPTRFGAPGKKPEAEDRLTEDRDSGVQTKDFYWGYACIYEHSM